MSNRAYVEAKTPLFQTAPRRFKSAKLEVSEMVYSLVFKPHSFPLSVIPKISTMFLNFTNENPFVEPDKLPVTFYIKSGTTILLP